MCVAIYLPAGESISNKTLKQCYAANPHSIGYMFATEGLLIVQKFMAYPEFLAAFRAQRERHTETDFVIHFRIASSGEIDLDNCHPFHISQDVAFCHNGILDDCYGDKKRNDTRHFSDDVLAPLVRTYGYDILFQPAMRELIEGNIGYHNKFIFMDATGRVAICNEYAGFLIGETWFSNLYWQPVPLRDKKKLGGGAQQIDPLELEWIEELRQRDQSEIYECEGGCGTIGPLEQRLCKKCRTRFGIRDYWPQDGGR